MFPPSLVQGTPVQQNIVTLTTCFLLKPDRSSSSDAQRPTPHDVPKCFHCSIFLSAASSRACDNNEPVAYPDISSQQLHPIWNGDQSVECCSHFASCLCWTAAIIVRPCCSFTGCSTETTGVLPSTLAWLSLFSPSRHQPVPPLRRTLSGQCPSLHVQRGLDSNRMRPPENDSVVTASYNSNHSLCPIGPFVPDVECLMLCTLPHVHQ